MIIQCKKCKKSDDSSQFKKNKRLKIGFEIICKNCIAWKEYLIKYSNGYYYKKCKLHGFLALENIIIIQRLDRGKYQIILQCYLCRNKWETNFLRNNNLKEERIKLNKKIECTVCKNNNSPENYIQSELKKMKPTCKKCWKEYSIRYENKVSISRKFKLTRIEYNRLSEKQNGLCAICNLPETTKEKEKTRRLAADHCHKTQQVHGETKIRGLLCTQCNNGLGRFKDDITLLENAIKYLKNNDYS